MNVILIGAGTMGRAHATAYAKMPDTKLVGIVDENWESACLLAQTVGTQAFGSLDEVAAAFDYDVVDICVPTPFHKRYILDAASRKKHVISEKPLCLNLEDARECIEACERAGVRFFVGQVVRFFPEYRQIHGLIEAGAIGTVGTARASRGGQFPRGWNDWYANTNMSGSLIVDLMIHDFDFLRWCFGEVERIYAKNVADHELNRMDHVFASVRFESGVIAHVEGSWAHAVGFSTEIEVSGQEGMLHHRSADSAPIRLVRRATQQGQEAVAVPASPVEHTPYYLELEHFIDCIRNRKEAIVTSEDAYKALEISLAAVESCKTGQPVILREQKG